MISRRGFVGSASAAIVAASAAVVAPPAQPKAPAAGKPGAPATPAAAPAELKSLTGAAQPIPAAERIGRIARVQELMTARQISALLVESGSTLEYFTGIRWRRSERTTAAIIPAKGPVLVVTPAFEEPSVRETLQVPGDVRPWDEPDDPFAVIVAGLRDRGAASGALAIEPTVRFFIVDGIRRLLNGHRIVSGGPLVGACRQVKSGAELALMQVANDVTLQALRWVHSQVARDMRPADIEALMNGATTSLGGSPEFSLVLLNEASAYPHGSTQAQSIRDGSVILMDCGCTVLGYQSDISRTWVFGDPSARQRKVWDTVKRGQEIALETAKLGTPVGLIDDAVRRYYQSQGWGPGYRLPGLPHRTGHGIGLDGHESAYLVHGDETPLQEGMCFSDEPGIYIPGEFGIRLEDCWHMTASGPQPFSPLARSVDDPV